MPVPDFDDIVFRNFNKEYGAYFLRKKYTQVLTLSIILAIIIGSVIVIIPFLKIHGQSNKEIYITRYVNMENLMVPPGQSGAPLPPVSSAPVLVKAPARIKTPEVKYIAPKVVDSIPLPEKSIAVSSDSTAGVVSETGDINGTGNDAGSSTGFGDGNGGGGNGTGGNGLYPVVEEMPKFKGGDINKFREWVQKKTKYPELATLNGIQGKVYVTFVVEKDGAVTNGKVVKGVDPIINNEALRAVMSSPKWSPGKQRGVAVRVSYLIMLNFQL